MLKDDIDLSVAIDFLDREIAKLNMQIVEHPEDVNAKEKLENVLKTKEDIDKGNAELIEKVINDAKLGNND